MIEEKNVPQQEKSSSVVTAKPTWHRPTVTRIDMKQTMAGSGIGGTNAYLDVNLS